MALEAKGFIELNDELSALANELYADDRHHGRATTYVLQSGAMPIKTRMFMNAMTDPKPVTRKLVNSIRIYRPIKRRKGGWTIHIGIAKSEDGAAYANPVEYGHGGPHPAPPHPFVRPAFDAGKDEAYAEMKAALASAIDHRKRKG